MIEHLNPKPIKPTRAVIIGAGGFVGGTICRRLHAHGVDTLALTRQEIDLTQHGASDKLKAILRPDDSVVMVSARAPVKNVTMLMQNLRMAESVCDALAAMPIHHLVYISSDAVYADDANPVTEQSYCAPSTLHGMMHASRELMLRTVTGAPAAVLRPTLIYGAADPHNGYGPNRFRRNAQRGEPIALFGEGEEQRDHVSVDDVAELARLILFHRSRGAINAATGIATSFNKIAHIIAAQFGNKVNVEETPRTVPRPHLVHRFFDITTCHQAFPAFRFISLEEGLALANKLSGRGTF